MVVSYTLTAAVLRTVLLIVRYSEQTEVAVQLIREINTDAHFAGPDSRWCTVALGR